MYHKYTKELLEPVIKNSSSWAQVCRHFLIRPMTGSQANIKKTAIRFGIDFSHFMGQAWSRGKIFGLRRPIEIYLVKDSTIGSHILKLKLFRTGIKKVECEECGLSEWKDQILPLELDHVNNDHTDCRIENLKIVCPNCHAVKTRRERKLRSRDVKEAMLVLETSAIKSV